MDNYKTCTFCKKTKPLSDFYNNKRHKDGKSYWCRECQRKKARDWQKNNPDVFRAYMERTRNRRSLYCEKYRKNPKNYEQIKKRNSAWLKTPKGSNYHKNWRLNKTYGITIDDYNKLLKHQNGVCAICGQFPDDGILVVDHNHKTNKIRGLLCHKCNFGIGIFRDSKTLLNNAVSYLDTGD